MRKYSQSPEEPDDPEAAPRLPEVPALPDVPKLKASLPSRPVEHKEQSQYGKAGLAYSLPAALVAPIVLFTVGGYFLDQKLHSGSKFTLAGALLGIVVGFVNMIRMASKLG